MRTATRACAELAAAATILACGCDGQPCSAGPTNTPEAPRITELTLFEQLEGDPYTVIFALAFADSDGDLGGGIAEFYINGAASAVQLALDDLFRQSALGADATVGEIAIPLRFAEDVQNGARVRLGVQVLDDGLNRSNCYSLELDFAVQAL